MVCYIAFINYDSGLSPASRHELLDETGLLLIKRLGCRMLMKQANISKARRNYQAVLGGGKSTWGARWE